MLTENMLHTLLQQMFKMALLCMDTIPEVLSLFVSHLINNCLLYARPYRLLYVFDCHGNKVSWYQVLSKLISYLPEDWRVFVDFVYLKLFILTNIC